MSKIKFCGITRPQDATTATELGASYIGVIFAESKRRVTLDEAREIFAPATNVNRVGVFGHGASLTGIIEHARELALDVLQLHGNFSTEEITRLRDEFDGELWPVIPVAQNAASLPEGWNEIADVSDALLFDTSVRGMSGGTGATFDWQALRPAIRQASAQIPIVLAGGLTHRNVSEAIATLHPAVVDVASGVESASGIKDPDLMRAFAESVVSASIV